ncbi:MAG TPA: uroporphyrinogen-III synthase [Stellaceae bacterium]|nr:uroporphyrinogen-III synthase [Stellaceae bacterium]
MRLLVTRPQPAAAALAIRLAARGHEVTIEPLLAIRPEPDAPARLAEALAGAQAVLFTSANGVEAFAAATSRRDLRAFAVGDATARAADAAGFAAVESAGGNVDDLARLVTEQLRPENGPLVHGRGEDVAGDLAGVLGTAGFTVRPVALYRVEPATMLSPAVAAAIRARAIDAALFFSPRTASSFVRLAAADGLQEDCASMAAAALSRAVATALEPLRWRRLEIAEAPTEAALLAAVDRLAGANGKQDEAMSDRRIEIEGTALPPPDAGAPGAGGAGAASSEASLGEAPRASAVGRTPRSRRLIGALVLLCVGLVAALASAPYWAPRFAGGSRGADGAALQQKIAGLQAELAGAAETRQRLAAAEQRLAGLEARGATPSAPRDAQQAQQAQALGQLSDRLAILEQRVASLDTSGTSASAEAVKSLQTAIQALEHRLDEQNQALGKLQQTQAQAPDRTDAALLLAVDQLRRAIATSRPYEVELASATALARERPEAAAALRPLEAHAGKGLPSLAVLAERLEQLAPTLANPEATAAADGDWRSAMLARIKGLVSVRRIGARAAAEGGGTEAAVAEAEAALKGNDLAGAVAAIRKLDGAAAETAKPWLADAEARLQAETAIAALDSALARRFLGEQPAGSKP